MKSIGYPASIVLHVAVLVAAVVSLPSVQPLAPAEESLPVEILTPEEFSAITKGEKTAKPQEKPQVKVDKVAEAKPEDDNPAETVKREAVSTPPPPQPKTEPKTEPTPEPPKPVAKVEPDPPKSDPPKPDPLKPDPPKPDLPKPEPRPEVKPEPKPVETPKPVDTPKPPDPKPIDKAETQKLDELALKALQEEPETEDEAKPEKKPETKPETKPAKPVAKPVEKPAKPVEKPAKVAETSKKANAPDPAQPSRSFDASRISALLSKEAPARRSRTDNQTSQTAALGSSRGNAPKLTLSQRSAIVGAIMNHVSPCWSPPSFAQDTSGLDVLVAVDLNEDGTLATDPQVIKYPANKSGSAAAGAAMRAIKRCVTAQTPLKLPPNLYASWREIEINFDPRQMAGG